VLEPFAPGLFEAIYVLLEKQLAIFVMFVWIKELFLSDRDVKVDFGFDVRLRVVMQE
jgi:hypothetical protein